MHNIMYTCYSSFLVLEAASLLNVNPFDVGRDLFRGLGAQGFPMHP